jgi:cysteine desulfurase
MLSIASHKIYGPQGIGALFIRRDLQAIITPRTFGGGQQLGLRPGTIPVALCRAFADAVRLATATKSDTERRHIQTLRDKFAGRMLANERIKLNGPPLAERHVANCNLQFIGRDAADLLARLQPHLAASTGSACSSGNVEPSYVLRAVGLSDTQARSSIRFSFGRQTTTENVERAAMLVERVLKKAADI